MTPSGRKRRRPSDGGPAFSAAVEAAIEVAIALRDASGADVPRPSDFRRLLERLASKLRAARVGIEAAMRDQALLDALVDAAEAQQPTVAVADDGAPAHVADRLELAIKELRALEDAAASAATGAPAQPRMDAARWLVGKLAESYSAETGERPRLPTYDGARRRSSGAFLDWAAPRFARFDKDRTREGLAMLIRRELKADPEQGQKRARRARIRPEP